MVSRAANDIPQAGIQRGTFIVRLDGKSDLLAGDLPGETFRVPCPDEPGADAPRLKPVTVGIYCGKGVTAGHLWHAKPLEESGIPFVLFDETSMHLTEGVDVVSFPSGGGYEAYISSEDQRILKQSVHDRGLGFLGTCGGNVFGVRLGLLDASLLQSDHGYTYGLNLHGFARLDTLAPTHPAMLGASKPFKPLYYSGQTFSSVGQGVELLAAYRDFGNCFSYQGKPYDHNAPNKLVSRPAVIAGSYGKGRVILCGPHPEIGEPRVFVDWVYYLGGGSSSRKRTMGATAPGMPEAAHLVPIAQWTALSAPIESMTRTVDRIAPQLQAARMEREREHKVLGQSVFLLWLDMKNRLNGIRSYLKEVGTTVGSSPATEESLHPVIRSLAHRLEVHRAALEEMIPRVLEEVELMRSTNYLSDVHEQPDHNTSGSAHGHGTAHHGRENAQTHASTHGSTASPIHYHAHRYMKLTSELKEPQVFLMGLEQTLKKVTSEAGDAKPPMANLGHGG